MQILRRTGMGPRAPTSDRELDLCLIIVKRSPGDHAAGWARTLAAKLAGSLPGSVTDEVDLAPFGPRVLDPSDPGVDDAVERVLAADVLVLASPTYKATYSGLLKAFLDRFGTGALAGAPAVPVLLGGAPNHQLAIDVHFTPLLLELGACVPARGLFVLESEVDDFSARAAAWVAEHLANVESGVHGRLGEHATRR